MSASFCVAVWIRFFFSCYFPLIVSSLLCYIQSLEILFSVLSLQQHRECKRECLLFDNFHIIGKSNTILSLNCPLRIHNKFTCMMIESIVLCITSTDGSKILNKCNKWRNKSAQWNAMERNYDQPRLIYSWCSWLTLMNIFKKHLDYIRCNQFRFNGSEKDL